MSVRGRSTHDYDYVTYCDFGDLNRRERIGRHFSKEAADKAFKRLRKIYSYESTKIERHLYRCWQEKRYTREIINDTGSPWQTTAR